MIHRERRINKTITFLNKTLETNSRILDLGVENELGKKMQSEGYTVHNTGGEDLDIDQSKLKENFDAVTAFEILEHTLNAFEILKSIKSPRLYASIPLRLWFASAYRSKTDPWDRHYHEFEDWQFDWLLEKTGWKIKDRLKWTNPTKKIGIRPLLRYFTNRYYIVYAEREV